MQDLLVNPVLPPNKEHPLARLSLASREDAMLRDFARILADIAQRKLQSQQPSTEDER